MHNKHSLTEAGTTKTIPQPQRALLTLALEEEEDAADAAAVPA